uniref:Uncharacterized protein n=1 Tax=Glossina morsitans morsitans TaxID=37546 RepID=A0A1B0GBY9_GLOMM
MHHNIAIACSHSSPTSLSAYAPAPAIGESPTFPGILCVAPFVEVLAYIWPLVDNNHSYGKQRLLYLCHLAIEEGANLNSSLENNLMNVEKRICDLALEQYSRGLQKLSELQAELLKHNEKFNWLCNKI